MINISKDVIWVFSLENPMALPSYIVSGILPADYNKIQKIIFLEHDNPKNLLIEKKPKVIIVGKVFHSSIIKLIKEARKLNVKIISIFDDWHFDKQYKNNSIYNLEIAINSNHIIAKTKKAIDTIYEHTKIKGKIIPDCLRYKTLKPIETFTNPYKLCWFGNFSNHPSLLKGIYEISKPLKKIELKIITNKLNNLKNSLIDIDQKLSLEFIEWTLSMHEYIKKSEIIIIPLINDKKSLVKSSNRIIDSLNMGKFVIINDNDQFSEFRDYCYFGNISDGLEWVYNNKDLAISMTQKGQEYVIENFSLKAVSEKWKSLIEKQ